MEKQITLVDNGLWCRKKRTRKYCFITVVINNKKAEKAVSNLTSVELYTENGFNLLLEKLHAAFQSEDVEDAYNIFLKFSYLKRHCDISMNDYIIEFENLNHLMENQNMKLLNKVLAFKSLDAAMISENQRQMCLALANNLTFNSTKNALS